MCKDLLAFYVVEFKSISEENKSFCGMNENNRWKNMSGINWLFQVPHVLYVISKSNKQFRQSRCQARKLLTESNKHEEFNFYFDYQFGT